MQHQSFKSAPGGDLCESVAMLLESAGFAARVFPGSPKDGSLIAEIRPKDARRRTAQLVDHPKTDIAAPETNEARARLKLLTARELSVLIEVAKGNSNKIAAYHLGISPRTVESPSRPHHGQIACRQPVRAGPPGAGGRRGNGPWRA